MFPIVGKLIHAVYQDSYSFRFPAILLVLITADHNNMELYQHLERANCKTEENNSKLCCFNDSSGLPLPWHQKKKKKAYRTMLNSIGISSIVKEMH